MIGFLRGSLLLKQPTQAVVEAGGVGYQVQIPVSTFYKLGKEGSQARLHIHTHMREGTIELYGFITAGERALFRRLISISGVGPKMALAILSHIGPGDLVAAIDSAELERIVQIPGIGKKTAERLILELKDKLPELRAELGTEAVPEGPVAAMKMDLISALINLGYRRRDAGRAAEGALKSAGDDRDFSALLKAALAHLTGYD